MKLIDKDKVVAELEKLYNLEYDNTSNLSCGKKIMLRNILLFLDTLEVKEADLEKEMSEYFIEHPDEFFSEKYKLFAKHFYELGLKERKGE